MKSVRAKCLHCGCELPPNKPVGRKKIYCSSSCREKHYRMRRAQSVAGLASADLVRTLLSRLSERERSIVLARAQKRPMSEIAGDLGISRTREYQIYDKVRRKLAWMLMDETTMTECMAAVLRSVVMPRS